MCIPSKKNLRIILKAYQCHSYFKQFPHGSAFKLQRGPQRPISRTYVCMHANSDIWEIRQIEVVKEAVVMMETRELVTQIRAVMEVERTTTVTTRGITSSKAIVPVPVPVTTRTRIISMRVVIFTRTRISEPYT